MKSKSKKNETSSSDDTLGKVKELREELFNLRIQNMSGALENTGKIRQVRREIARQLTKSNMPQAKQ